MRAQDHPTAVEAVCERARPSEDSADLGAICLSLEPLVRQISQRGRGKFYRQSPGRARLGSWDAITSTVFVVSSISGYPFSGDGVKFDPKEVLGRS